MVQWTALQPHGKKILSVNLAGNRGLFVGCLHVLSVPVWVSFGCSSFSPKTCTVNVSVNACLPLLRSCDELTTCPSCTPDPKSVGIDSSFPTTLTKTQ